MNILNVYGEITVRTKLGLTLIASVIVLVSIHHVILECRLTDIPTREGLPLSHLEAASTYKPTRVYTEVVIATTCA